MDQYLTSAGPLGEHLAQEVSMMEARRIVREVQATLPPGRMCWLCSQRDCDHIPRGET